MAADGRGLARGFAWFIYHDPAHAHPSAFLEPPRPARCWPVEGTEVGLGNPIWGEAYLLLTETSEVPPLERPWVVEPAELEEGFAAEAPEGCVRLARLVGIRRTPWGIVQECELEVTPGQSACEAFASDGGARAEEVPLALPPFLRLGNVGHG